MPDDVKEQAPDATTNVPVPDQPTSPGTLPPILSRSDKPARKKGSVEERIDALEAENEARGQTLDIALAELRLIRKKLEEKNARKKTGDLRTSDLSALVPVVSDEGEEETTEDDSTGGETG